jgi:hypothetical protein
MMALRRHLNHHPRHIWDFVVDVVVQIVSKNAREQKAVLLRAVLNIDVYVVARRTQHLHAADLQMDRYNGSQVFHQLNISFCKK